MKKLLYTLIVVLITTTVTLIYFIQTMNREAEIAVGGNYELVGQKIISQEPERIRAIESVSDAIVGVVNLQAEVAEGKGSGVIYKVENGNTYIVTNEHVITGGDSFVIVFANEEQIMAELVGSDIYTDLAVLRIVDFEAEVVARFGNSEELRIGQSVIAIGNPLGLDFAGSATFGIISGQGRSVPVTLNNSSNEEWEMTVLQTDAAVNPGNSGGALINLDGEVIGINSMKFVSNKIEGMSFAIPTYVVLPVIEALETHGEVLRPMLGISSMNVSDIPQNFRDALDIPDDQKTGAFINEIGEGSLAERMGLQNADIVLAINNEEVTTVSQLRRRLFSYRDGDEITLTVLRGEEIIELTAEIRIH